MSGECVKKTTHFARAALILSAAYAFDQDQNSARFCVDFHDLIISGAVNLAHLASDGSNHADVSIWSVSESLELGRVSEEMADFADE
jgi:hypothetical protein